jgi:predicted membrane GTPase involved in stress response
MGSNNYETSNRISRIAGGVIAAKRLVKLDSTAGQVIACTAITDIAIGVSLHSATAGQSVEIQTSGVAEIECSDAVALGAEVMPTAAGAGKCVTAAGATARSAGLAENLSAADGEVIRARINLPNLKGMANA